jgi:ATP-dependent RNA circularization protein (DNA/RNA ligase family)
MTEYHKIETLFERDSQTFKVCPDKLRNPIYGLFKSWQFTEKIDGTNIRAIWRNGIVDFKGRTDRAQIHQDLLKYLQENITVEKLNSVFEGKSVVIYGEGYGAGIQKGGGNYSPTKRFIVFDILIDDKWWLNWENVCLVSEKLGLDVVPLIGEFPLEDGIEMVKSGFASILAKQKTGIITKAEGIVGRTLEPLFDKHGKRIIIKLKSVDFDLKGAK